MRPIAKLVMSLALAGLLLAGLFIVALASGQANGSFEQHTLLLQGRERTYFVYHPRNRQATEAKPVVFVLHGGGGADAHEMARRTGMNSIADREGFLVVYPYGVDGQWNEGRGKTFRSTKSCVEL